MNEFSDVAMAIVLLCALFGGVFVGVVITTFLIVRSESREMSRELEEFKRSLK